MSKLLKFTQALDVYIDRIAGTQKQTAVIVRHVKDGGYWVESRPLNAATEELLICKRATIVLGASLAEMLKIMGKSNQDLFRKVEDGSAS